MADGVEPRMDPLSLERFGGHRTNEREDRRRIMGRNPGQIGVVDRKMT